MIRVAVIGAGHWGPNLIRNFHNRQQSEVRWVADLDQARLAQVRARFPDVQLTSQADQALRDPEVDAVVVSTPTSTHFPIAKAALEARKHVLVEKPIAANAEEARELAELSERAGRVLMVGHVFVYNAAVRKVREYITSGHLGRIYYVSMVRTNLGPIRVDVNAAWDLAAHDISIVNYWLGATPLTASAVGGTWINKGLEDAVFATLRFPKEVLVNLHVSWLNPRKSREVTVVGDQRMLTFDDMNLSEPLRIYDKQVTGDRTKPGFIDTFATFRASVRDGDITIPKVATGEPLKAECDHFLECIAKGERPLTGAKEGMDVVRALEAVQRSVRGAGREEKVE
ncbi:MAG: Gfo/Idh/MocA family oxidoreductase [Myxococcales bacterium]|nr:Gfo/Idh/MocA family oxidoreductase [Myxococcales bacterium]